MSEDKPDKPEYRDVLRTPLEVTNRMNWVLFYIRKATHAIHDLRGEYIDAKDAYSRAFRQHAMDLLDKPRDEDEKPESKTDREDRAQLANWGLYRAMNQAEHQLQYAKEKKNDLEGELSKLQSESRLIIKEMELAGRGQA